LSGLPADAGQLRRIRDQLTATLDSGADLLKVAREAGGAERVKQIARDLSAIAGAAGPELRRLGARLDAALLRLDQLAAVFSPERRTQLAGALATLRRAVALGERLLKDADA